MKRILMTSAAAVALAAIATSCVPGKTHKISGSLTIGAAVPSEVFYRVVRKELAGECSGWQASEGFKDIDRGTSIVVKDSAGKIVAKSSLNKGITTNLGQNGACLFMFEVDRVPESDFYTVEIGSRKPMNYSAEELKKQNWELMLALGMG